MKKIITLAISLIGISIFSQVGINNTNPKATLDITAGTTDDTKPEGLIAPRLNGDDIQRKDNMYGIDQKGTIVYAKSPVTVQSLKTANINTEGYYYFDGNVWQRFTIGNPASVTNNVIRKAGATYTSLSASDLTSLFNTLSLITSAPAGGFLLTSLTVSDIGKTLYIQNNTGANFLVNYTDDLSASTNYTLQNTRGAVFVWSGNGWIRGTF